MAISQGAAPYAPAVPLRECMLLSVLFATMLLSSIAVIEPSPHDAMMGVLAIACVTAGVRMDRRLVVLLLLLIVWNFGGLMSLLNVPDAQKPIQYVATSIYLGVAAMLFACMFCDNTMSRLASMRTAYIATAVFTALTGIVGYFHLIPGAFGDFELNGRAMGTFKDPNVFGPFLIWPALFLMMRTLLSGIKARDLVLLGIILTGLLLSFSRGAWINFAVAGAVNLSLAIMIAPNPRARLRIVVIGLVSLAVLVAFVGVLLSFQTVREMYAQRAQAIQYYDVGEGGRFRLQELALGALLNYPNGMGPLEFARVFGLQQHNVYLQAFMVYGWFGGVGYLMLLLATFVAALRGVFIATPWQPYLITATAAFAGNVFEGVVIDTDHWRHFFLLMGMVWGLSAASAKAAQQHRMMLPAARI
jgi:hypothetical protein